MIILKQNQIEKQYKRNGKKPNKRKIPLIPPLFINNIFVINLNGKQIYLMNFLASNVDQQLKIVHYHHYLKLQIKLFPLSKLQASVIGKIIKASDVNKAHGPDEISIMMFSPYESVINELLYCVFKNCLSRKEDQRKTNEVPVHKKGDKEKLKIYRLVSLLLICGKRFEKSICNTLYSFSVDHKLLNLCQSRSDVL